MSILSDVKAYLVFYVQTTLKAFKKADFTTVREHDEFVWLHDRFVENEEYAGIIVSDNGKNMLSSTMYIASSPSLKFCFISAQFRQLSSHHYRQPLLYIHLSLFPLIPDSPGPSQARLQRASPQAGTTTGR